MTCKDCIHLRQLASLSLHTTDTIDQRSEDKKYLSRWKSDTQKGFEREG